MNTLLIILLIVIIVLIGIASYFSNKLLRSNYALEKEIKKIKKTNAIDDFNKNLADLSELLLQDNTKLEESMNELKNSISIEVFNDNLAELSNQLDKLNREDHKKWLRAAESISDEDRKLEYFESAARRFPNKKIFIDKIIELLGPLANNDNLLVRREALMRLRDHANRFVAHAPLENFDDALQIRDEIIGYMKKAVEKLDNLREQTNSDLLTDLESKISDLEAQPKDNQTLKEIEKLDEDIDKEILSNYPDLQKKYDILSKSLIGILNNNTKASKKSLKSYNKKALRKAKSVLDKIQNHSEGKLKDNFVGPDNPVNYNKRSNLTNLVESLSGFNSEKLLPTTENYIRMVESQVFSKLSSEGKKVFTKLMIEKS